MSRRLRRFSPMEATEGLEQIDPALLVRHGKKLVLMDVDNTLLPWRAEEVPVETLAWVSAGREAGLDFCLVSNTRRVARLEKLAKTMGAGFVRARNKPSRRMYRQALLQYKVEPSQAVMIGDQLLTDVWGANRAGIDAIWVRPMSVREFVGTRWVSRFVERLLRFYLYRHISGEQRQTIRENMYQFAGPFRYRIVRQIFKFCVVGGTSLVIDAGIHRVLLYHVNWGGQPLQSVFGTWLSHALGHANPTPEDAYQAAASAFKVVSASIAILNSFIWNRAWTFGIRGPTDRSRQLAKFVIVSVLGLLWNALLFSAISRTLPPSNSRWWIATLVAAALVAIWNFSGQRLWALKQREVL